MIKSSRGFTIIELIVVMAIVAVLATIVLVNVVGYNNKGKDAAIKGNLAELYNRGVRYFADSTLGNGTYSGFCASSSGGGPVGSAITNPNLGSTFACNVKADNSTWCACSQEKSNTTLYFCVDSTGAKKEVATACATECPALAAVCQ